MDFRSRNHRPVRRRLHGFRAFRRVPFSFRTTSGRWVLVTIGVIALVIIAGRIDSWRHAGSGKIIATVENPVDINNASKEQLKTLPYIGDITADRIIAGRPYLFPIDLLGVEGIGDVRLETLRPLIVVNPPNLPPEPTAQPVEAPSPRSSLGFQ